MVFVKCTIKYSFVFSQLAKRLKLGYVAVFCHSKLSLLMMYLRCAFNIRTNNAFSGQFVSFSSVYVAV